MKHRQHCDECREKLGYSFYQVHRWLDHYAELTYPQDVHRLYRHHADGVEEVRRRWGDKAAEAARLHILADVSAYGMDHVPSAEEAEKLWDYTPLQNKEKK